MVKEMLLLEFLSESFELVLDGFALILPLFTKDGGWNLSAKNIPQK